MRHGKTIDATSQNSPQIFLFRFTNKQRINVLIFYLSLGVLLSISLGRGFIVISHLYRAGYHLSIGCDTRGIKSRSFTMATARQRPKTRRSGRMNSISGRLAAVPSTPSPVIAPGRLVSLTAPLTNITPEYYGSIRIFVRASGTANSS